MRDIASHHSLRGLAALTVFLIHARIPTLLPEWTWLRGVHDYLSWHNQAVDLFFQLSGFILAYIYSGPRPFHWREYAVARFARVYPLYLAGILAIVAINLAALLSAKGNPWQNFVPYTLVTNVLGLQEWPGFGQPPSINQPSWSISVEFFLYAVIFPLSLHYVKWARKHLWAAGTLIVVLSLLMATIHATSTSDTGFPYERLLRGIAGFIQGGLLCCVAEAWGYFKPAPKTHLSWRAVWPDLLLIVTFLACLGLGKGRAALLLIFPWLILRATREDTLLARALSIKPLVWLGTLSFSMYIWHRPVLEGLSAVYRVLFLGGADLATASFPLRQSYTALVIVLVFAVSWASLHFFETPTRNLIRHFANLRAKKPGA